MNILITGVHGFVSAIPVSALKTDNTIYILDIEAREIDGVNDTSSWEDMDNDRLPQDDAIIQLSGKAHDS